MGTQTTTSIESGDDERRAMRRVLRDLDALERMIELKAFESDRRRIGVEQELVLVDQSMQPAPVAVDVLDRVNDPRVVPEIARFNVEYNCDPIEVDAAALSRLESQITELYQKVDRVCRDVHVRALMTGICPTVDLTHVGPDSIMPNPRYKALDNALRRLRGDEYEIRIDGADELILRHPTVMLEAFNTSFQVHFQTSPDEFAGAYNTALAVTAPVLASAVNSPVLFGKRLWRETRIAVFQQVVDTRGRGAGNRDFRGRVRFGESWVQSSILEVLREDVSRFRQILHRGDDSAPDPVAEIEAGRVPSLKSWQAFNSSVYRWMRPCYGITNGRPHLRIENRVLPSGPTIADEVANAAFWIGLMLEGPHRWPDIHERLELRDARSNFLRVSRDGLAAQMTWIDGTERPVGEMILHEFIPAARDGLTRAGIDPADIDRTLKIIEGRVDSRRTGAHWLIQSVAQLRGVGSRGARLADITCAMLANQDSGRPVHEWPEIGSPDVDAHGNDHARVSQCMTTDLYTLTEDDCIDLAASIMDWEHIRHIPVEDKDHRLIGLVSYRKLLRLIARGQPITTPSGPIRVADIMEPDPVTVSPDTPTLEAITLMRNHHIACLPVVEDGRLVGILSDRDYTDLARTLLERALRDERQT
ncbi:MAG: glutamate-cysteine ligase family protein [Planctomycetota bacterium]